MATGAVKGTSVAISPEVNAQLKRLRALLHAEGLETTRNEPVVEALILAAVRSPIEAVKAVVELRVAAVGRAALEAERAERTQEGDGPPSEP